MKPNHRLRWAALALGWAASSAFASQAAGSNIGAVERTAPVRYAAPAAVSAGAAGKSADRKAQGAPARQPMTPSADGGASRPKSGR